MMAEKSIREAVRRSHEGEHAMRNGDAEPFKALWSRHDDVTAFPGYDGLERGWEEVASRWEWMARIVRARQAGGTATIRPLTTIVTPELAYTTELHDLHLRRGSDGTPVERTNRVTHIYRLEDDEWRLIHRHLNHFAPRFEPNDHLDRLAGVFHPPSRPPQRSQRAADAMRTTQERVRDAVAAVLSGRAEPMKALWSHRDDATIFDPWGGYGRGWDELSEHWDWVAQRIESGSATYEAISAVATPRLAYTTGIATVRAHFRGADKPTEWTNCVTHIFRLEDGEWRLMHRHSNRFQPRRDPQ